VLGGQPPPAAAGKPLSAAQQFAEKKRLAMERAALGLVLEESERLL